MQEARRRFVHDTHVGEYLGKRRRRDEPIQLGLGQELLRPARSAG
jgi:hypothetical protein